VPSRAGRVKESVKIAPAKPPPATDQPASEFPPLDVLAHRPGVKAQDVGGFSEDEEPFGRSSIRVPHDPSV